MSTANERMDNIRSLIGENQSAIASIQTALHNDLRGLVKENERDTLGVVRSFLKPVQQTIKDNRKFLQGLADFLINPAREAIILNQHDANILMALLSAQLGFPITALGRGTLRFNDEFTEATHIPGSFTTVFGSGPVPPGTGINPGGIGPDSGPCQPDPLWGTCCPGGCPVGTHTVIRLPDGGILCDMTYRTPGEPPGCLESDLQGNCIRESPCDRDCIFSGVYDACGNFIWRCLCGDVPPKDCPPIDRCPPGTKRVINPQTGCPECVPDPPPPPGGCPPGTRQIGIDPTTGEPICKPDEPPPPPKDPVCEPPKDPCTKLPCGPVKPLGPGEPPKKDDLNQPAEVWGNANALDDVHGSGWEVYVGAAPPEGPPGKKLSGPHPLSRILSQVIPLLPPGAVPKILVPSGPVSKPGEPCPPAPCEPPKPEPPKAGECKLPPDIPADVERCFWDETTCLTLEKFAEGFAKLGEFIRGEFTKALGETADALDTLDTLKDAPVIGPIIGKLAMPAKAAAGLIRLLKCTIEQIQTFWVVKNADLLTGLTFARALVQALENVRFGFNLGLYVTAQVQIQLLQLDRISEYLLEWVQPTKVPTPDEIIAKYLGGHLTPAHAQTLTELNGICWSEFEKYIHTQRTKVSGIDLEQYFQRFGWPEISRDAVLKNYGYIDPVDRDVLRKNHEYFPPPSDLLLFNRRDVWDVNKLGREDMLQELQDSPDLLHVLNAANIKPIEYMGADGKMRVLDVPGAYYISSFHEISPTQAFEMLHRLRPNRVSRYQLRYTPTIRQAIRGSLAGARIVSVEPNGDWIVEPEPVDMTHVQALLKEDDYNPVWRTRLAAISYRNLTRVDLRRVYLGGLFGQPKGLAGWDLTNSNDPKPIGQAESEVLEYYKDLGYANQDAAGLAVFSSRDYDLTVRGPVNKRYLNTVCEAYSSGIISAKDAIEEVKQNHPYPQEAERIVGLCDLNMKVKDTKTMIASVKKMYMRGEATEADVGNLLKEIGVTGERSQQFYSVWRLERMGRSKQQTAATFCRWHSNDLITLDEMYTRLTRMGWSDIDARRVIRNCQIKREEQQAKEREKELRELLAAEKRARAGETETNIRNWLRSGLIRTEQAADMLRDKEWLERDIELWLIQATRPTR